MHSVCVVVGAGAAGLATSRVLAERGVDHVVLERDWVGHTWRTQRWDSFKLNTPGWMNGVLGDVERDSFWTAPEVVARLAALSTDLPVRQHSPVLSLERDGNDFVLRTPDDVLRSPTVVLATGNQNVPRLPALAGRIDERVQQLHAAEFRNQAALDAGAVLVVGSAQSGCQIAEDLVAAGRRVYLATSRVGRAPWGYRGCETVEWLLEAGFFDQRPEDLEDPAMTHAPQPVVGSGGRSLSLQMLARAGITLLGRIVSADGRTVTFDDSAAANVAFADGFASRALTLIDMFIDRSGAHAPPPQPDEGGGAVEVESGSVLDLDAAEVGSVIWCTGFTGDFSWVHLPVLDGAGQPEHDRGATAEPGLWVVGLPWLTRRSSGIFFGFPGDATHIAEAVTAHLAGSATTTGSSR